MLLTFQAAVLIVWCSTVVYCQTHTEDLNALKSLSTSLFPAPNSAAAPATWTSSIDACGHPNCGTSACNLNGFASFDSQLPACNWAGICCSRWRVASISLPEPEPAPAFQPLPFLPIELQNLQSLTELSLPQRGLAGTLPPQFGNLSALVTLNLAGNNISGFLPSSWSQLRSNRLQLKTLDLSGNKLEGQIPITWFSSNLGSGLAYFPGLNLAGNSGLCNPASGRQLPYALQVCDDNILQAQQQADPAAVAGAVSQPALMPTAPPGPLIPGSYSNQSSDTVRLLWPFLAVAAAGLLVCCLMAVGRKWRQGPRQEGFPHSRSRRRTAPCDAAIDPPGPPPCLVLGPDGAPLALAIQETPTENPLKAFQASSTPETNKDAELDQSGEQIQVRVDLGHEGGDQSGSSASATAGQSMDLQQQRSEGAGATQQGQWPFMHQRHPDLDS